jgi:hypothetical protein
MENGMMDNHAAFNRWQVMQGTRVNESGTEPSVYITEVKLKKIFRKLSNEGVENLFEREMSLIAVERHREFLEKKLASLDKTQLFAALNMFIQDEDIDKCATYVLNCKRSEPKDI